MLSEPLQSPVVPGEILGGKYRIGEVIGAGGMGIVVSATHLELSQKVAVKFLFHPPNDSSGLQERFLREARAAARLQSPHVARVIDFGSLTDGSPYMVMEYLDGVDLAAQLSAHGRLDVKEAVRYVLEACDAVSEAHSQGIIHRDLKPSNLFLCRKHKGATFVKVLDFGISKVKDLPGLDKLTRTGEMVGSPSYMSPEQIRAAKTVDERADIWSFGVILYELLTADLPFPANNVPQLCALILETSPVPLSKHRADIPPNLERIIYRCLEKDPSRRFQTLDELIDALVAFSQPEGLVSANQLATLPTVCSPAAAGPVAITQAAPTPQSDAYAVSGFDRTLCSQSSTVPKPAIKSYRWFGVVGVLVGLAFGIGALVVGARGRRAQALPSLSSDFVQGQASGNTSIVEGLPSAAASLPPSVLPAEVPSALSVSSPTKLSKKATGIPTQSARPPSGAPAQNPPKAVDLLLPAERK